MQGSGTLNGKRGSLLLYVTGYRLDPMPLVSSNEGKSKWLLAGPQHSMLRFRVILVHVEKTVIS